MNQQESLRGRSFMTPVKLVKRPFAYNSPPPSRPIHSRPARSSYRPWTLSGNSPSDPVRGRQRCDHPAGQPVEAAFVRADPDGPFPILKDAPREVAGQSVGRSVASEAPVCETARAILCRGQPQPALAIVGEGADVAPRQAVSDWKSV